MSSASDQLLAWARAALPVLNSRISQTHAAVDRARDTLWASVGDDDPRSIARPPQPGEGPDLVPAERLSEARPPAVGPTAN